jgi:hypothetical protein
VISAYVIEILVAVRDHSDEAFVRCGAVLREAYRLGLLFPTEGPWPRITPEGWAALGGDTGIETERERVFGGSL